VLVFFVFLSTCCVLFSAQMFVDVFPVIVLSFGVATRVTTCPYPLCVVGLVATFSRWCVATLKQSSVSCKWQAISYLRFVLISDKKREL